MIRIKSLQQRQRIFDDLTEVAQDPDFLDKLNRGKSGQAIVTPEQLHALGTVDGVIEQIDGHLDEKNLHGMLYWYDADGLIQRAGIDFDFI